MLHSAANSRMIVYLPRLRRAPHRVISINVMSICWLWWTPLFAVPPKLDLPWSILYVLVTLQPVYESCLQLKVLKLQACKYLTDTSLEPSIKKNALPALCELDLSYGTLCQSAIEELLACCTHLSHVSLNGCINMHDLNWGFSGDQLSQIPSVSIPHVSSLGEQQLSNEQPKRLLENLNCVGCPNIKGAYSNGTRFPFVIIKPFPVWEFEGGWYSLLQLVRSQFEQLLFIGIIATGMSKIK